jgi:hypothetical protein
MIPTASDSGYLAYCGWCAHYVRVPEAFARSAESARYVCPAGRARRDAHPQLRLCVRGCGHFPNVGMTSQGIRQGTPEDCPACGEPQDGRNRVTELDDAFRHVACAACGHTWIWDDSPHGEQEGRER